MAPLLTPQNQPSRRLRILWIKSGPVDPPNTGGRLRSYQMLRALHQQHKVHFLALGTADQDSGLKYASSVEFLDHSPPVRGTAKFVVRALANTLTDKPLSLTLYENKSLTNRIRQLVAEQTFDLIVCDFLTPALSVPKELRGRCVLFQHNIEALIWERMIATATSGIMRKYLGQQHRRMERWERELSRQFGRVITVSEEDSQIARSEYGLTNVAGHVPTGVDAAHFSELLEQPRDPAKICFLGSMDWLPNIDGVDWFLSESWPRIHRRRPELTLSVIGRNPPHSLLSAWNGIGGVRFTGTVDDIKPHLAGASAAIVPLRVGGGTRLKILELMAAGIPVISTTIGAEGLPLEDRTHFLRADTPDELDSAIDQVLANPAMAAQMADRALADVVEPNSWSHCADVFLQLALGNPTAVSYGNVATKPQVAGRQ